MLCDVGRCDAMSCQRHTGVTLGRGALRGCPGVVPGGTPRGPPKGTKGVPPKTVKSRQNENAFGGRPTMWYRQKPPEADKSRQKPSKGPQGVPSGRAQGHPSLGAPLCGNDHVMWCDVVCCDVMLWGCRIYLLGPIGAVLDLYPYR